MPPAAWIAVCGPADASPDEVLVAEEAGAAVAAAGAVLVCGGLGGVMEGACRGARSRNGLTVGLLPGERRDDANGWVSVSIPTGLGEGRNVLIVRAADALIAIGGSWGTLSEVALGMRRGIPVVTVGSWELSQGGRPVEGVQQADGPVAAVELAVAQLQRSRR